MYVKFCGLSFWKICSRVFTIIFQQRRPPQTRVHFDSNSHWRTLNLEFTDNMFGSCSGLFGFHLFYLVFQFVISLSLAATCSDVTVLKLNINIWKSIFFMLISFMNCVVHDLKQLSVSSHTLTDWRHLWWQDTPYFNMTSRPKNLIILFLKTSLVFSN